MTEDPARARFFAISLVRLAGVAIGLLGVVIIAKRLVEPAEIVGGLLLTVALIDIMVLPLVLARRWRSPK